ncbi:hypothetical protein cypCar_00023670 [Scomber scombrus]|uniref:Cyclin-dependent kinases regulatory subunit n=1 Tax=Scomber scombrus TaxID=13677 RepID=A0AAV1MRB8_SCOSC
MSHKQIYYSDKYDDEKYEYRHVMLPKDLAKRVPKTHLMSESEWRNLGVQQSQGWSHISCCSDAPCRARSHKAAILWVLGRSVLLTHHLRSTNLKWRSCCQIIRLLCVGTDLKVDGCTWSGTGQPAVPP